MLVAGARGEDCTACGVGCSNRGNNGNLHYIGGGQGEYVQTTNFRYVGNGGDFSSARPRRDCTCCLVSLCLLLSLLLPLLLWLFWPTETDSCVVGRENWEFQWSTTKKSRCCFETQGAFGCEAIPATFRPAPGPVDPFNCENDQFEWQAGWSDEKKSWCCSIHGSGCPSDGVVPFVPPSSYDCNAGGANWVKGWSAPKKSFCCTVNTKFCNENIAGPGYGAGAGDGDGIMGAPIATAPPGFVPASQTR